MFKAKEEEAQQKYDKILELKSQFNQLKSDLGIKTQNKQYIQPLVTTHFMNRKQTDGQHEGTSKDLRPVLELKVSDGKTSSLAQTVTSLKQKPKAPANPNIQKYVPPPVTVTLDQSELQNLHQAFKSVQKFKHQLPQSFHQTPSSQ